MASQEYKSKASAPTENVAHIDPDTPAYERNSDGNLVLPSGWKYKQFRIGPLSIPWYASPAFQLTLVAVVCFMCPGMFNALSGLGGGGKTDTTLADDMNTALYSTFAVFGFFGGTVVNKVGVKLTLAFGGVGYCIYALSLLLSVHFDVFGFNIFAGAFLGVCAGLLWTAQGTIMISYPLEKDKGKYFAYFWAIFNLGGVLGSLIPLGQNIHVRTNSNVNDGTYIAFIILMAIGACLALTLANAKDVIRRNGTHVVLKKNPTWTTEFIGLYESISFNPYILLLFPMFWSSNWFYTYQQNAVNDAHFDTRTKALNSCLYYLAQIVGALILGLALDITSISRSMRAKIAWGFLFAMTMIIWGGGYAFQKQYTRADTSADDWTTPGYVGPMFLYIFYGMYDSFWQCTVYWYIGALSNSGRRSANYAGFYKGLQSAGAAVMWSIDSRKTSYMNEFISNWVLLGGSLLVAAPVIFMKITNHTTLDEDLTNTGETIEDVVEPSVLHEQKTIHNEV